MRVIKQEPGYWWFDTIALYHRINVQMEMKRLSLRVAAEEIGVDFTTISKLRVREPSVQTVTRICQWLQLPLDTFVRRELEHFGEDSPLEERPAQRRGYRSHV